MATKTSGDTDRKILNAVLLGPLLIVPVMLLSFFLLSTFGGDSYPIKDLALTCAIMGFWGLLIAYPVTLIILVPIFLILRRFDKHGLFYFLFASSIVATPIALYLGYGILYATLFVFYFNLILVIGFWLVYQKA